jgi:hypothetical protein
LASAQESRSLSGGESQLKKLLKSKILGLAAIERSRAHQRSRLTWIKKGDANTHYFHIVANTRRKNNFISLLNNGTESATTQTQKHHMLFQHFQNHIGSSVQRNHTLNFVELGWQPLQLHHLDLPFSELEVEKTIKALPKQKAHRPDGVIGTFFRACWNTIKADYMSALDQFYSINQQGLHFLNQALIVLIQKNRMLKE